MPSIISACVCHVSVITNLVAMVTTLCHQPYLLRLSHVAMLTELVPMVTTLFHQPYLKEQVMFYSNRTISHDKHIMPSLISSIICCVSVVTELVSSYGDRLMSSIISARVCHTFSSRYN